MSEACWQQVQQEQLWEGGWGCGDDFTQMLLGQPLSSGRCFCRPLLRSMRASGIHTRHLQVFWFKMHSERKTEKRISCVKSQLYGSAFSPVIKNACFFKVERWKAHYDIISDTEIIIKKTLPHQRRNSTPLIIISLAFPTSSKGTGILFPRSNAAEALN